MLGRLDLNPSGRKNGLEFADGLSGTFIQPGLDLMDQHVAGPAMFDGGRRVPEAGFGIAVLLQQHEVMSPWQSCNRLFSVPIRTNSRC